MFVRTSTRRPGRGAHARRACWLVVPLLVALAFALIGTSAAAEPVPSRPGPEGLPVVPVGPGPRIVGGTAVPDQRYPFQAALLIQSAGTTDRQRQFCGGSLISSTQVLTAAHCSDFFGLEPGQVRLSDLRVVVGRTVLSSSQGQRRSAQAIAVHPRWDAITFSYDVAVITLAQPVVGIRPILVNPGIRALDRPGRFAIATGWGNILAQPAGSEGGSSFPDRMRQVSLPIVSRHTCDIAMTFDGVHFLDGETMLCAGRAGRDTCQGDSSGPLFTSAVAGIYVQIGITSWGIGCAATGYPGVYTKLSNRDIGRFILTTVVPT